MKIPVTDQFLWDLYGIFEEAGDVTSFLLNPRAVKWNRLWAIQNPIFERYRKARGRKQFADMVYHLKKSNYIQVRQLQSKTAVMLTEKGRNKAAKVFLKMSHGKAKKRKDGKWIMIIFDIPQRHNKARNLLRSILENLGYKMFQHSVWVTPFDVSEKTEELLQRYSLDDYIHIFLIEKLA